MPRAGRGLECGGMTPLSSFAPTDHAAKTHDGSPLAHLSFRFSQVKAASCPAPYTDLGIAYLIAVQAFYPVGAGLSRRPQEISMRGGLKPTPTEKYGTDSNWECLYKSTHSRIRVRGRSCRRCQHLFTPIHFWMDILSVFR